MPNYLTRDLVALRDIDHGGHLVRAGDSFTATDVDAGWYLARKYAEEVKEAPKPAAKRAAAPPPAPKSTTEAPKAGATTLADVDPVKAEQQTTGRRTSSRTTDTTSSSDASAQGAGEKR